MPVRPGTHRGLLRARREGGLRTRKGLTGSPNPAALDSASDPSSLLSFSGNRAGEWCLWVSQPAGYSGRGDGLMARRSCLES